MKLSYYSSALVVLLMLFGVGDASAQFVSQWLDIGEYAHAYVESGARDEVNGSAPQGMEWPQIMRNSSHMRAKAFWIGVKDWTDERGRDWPYFVARIGPRSAGVDVTFPVFNRLVSRYDDPVVEVDGATSFAKVAVIDEVDPSIPADRMIHNRHNMIVGVTIDR